MKPSLEKGTLVRIKKTGEEGIVERIPGTLMVRIRLKSNGKVITQSPDDLVVIGKARRPSASAEALTPAITQETKAVRQAAMQQKQILLAIEPIHNYDGDLSHFVMYLINKTPYDTLYNFCLTFKNKSGKTEQSGLLKPTGFEKIGQFLLDELNEHPIVEASCKYITTAGETPETTKELSIKPKSLFTTTTHEELSGKFVFPFVLFQGEMESKSNNDIEDLKNYTKKKAQQAPANSPYTHSDKKSIKNDPNALANFPHDIDLHIDKLMPGHGELSNGEILQIQLNAFENYLEEAMQVGKESVFIIHGVGEGVLRTAIHERLKTNAAVKTFVNEYHALYGWGATEVFLK